MVKKKLLSLCLITENDAKYLSNCLENMQEYVDEIIIVDRASRDLTSEIAQKFGANVYQKGWENDYSKAKNFCLNQAQGRWALFLQANEIISTQQLKELRQLLENPNVEGYLLYIDNFSQNYRITSPVQSLRLIRNRKEFQYKYKAFERIPDELLSNIKDSGIRIVQQPDLESSGDFDQLSLLLEKDLKKNPEDSYLQYMYGIELLNQQRFEESIKYLEKARQNVNFDYLFAPHLYKCLSWALISRERLEDALDVLEEGIKNFPFYTDFLVLRGELKKQLKEYWEAIGDLEKGLKLRGKSNTMVPEPEINITVILETLGDIHEEVFNYHRALIYYQQAYELNKGNPQILYKIGNVVKKVNNTEILANLLQQSIEESNLQQLIVIMDILFQQREYHKVLAHLDNLESLLGKGEQTESIKASCYMMLGELKKAELSFSSILKESPFYNHMLLQRMEGYWIHGKWQKVRQVLKEMDEALSIENNIKALYHFLHQLLTEEEPQYRDLKDQEYEIVSTLMESFLWLGKVDKARLLIPLLQRGNEDKYINLGVLWAEQNDYQIIERIFGQISTKEKQLEFKQKVLEQFLGKEQIETAQKVISLGDKQPLGPLEYVVWSQGFIKKLKESLEEINQTMAPQTPAKPSKSLVAFYQFFALDKNAMNESSLELTTLELTCSKIHSEIGDFYRKAKKNQEAFSAFLRALQWQPLDNLAQEKIKEMFQENPNQFSKFLEEKNWFLEGSWFQHKQEFIDYILGVIDFRNQQFEKALASFHKIGKDETSYPLALAYIISSLWLTGKESEAERWLKEQSGPFEIVSKFFSICKGYALDRLNVGHQQFPYSELIRVEKERMG